MASKTDFLEDKILNKYFGDFTDYAPASLYLALYTAAPTEAQSDATVGEVSSAGTWSAYARVKITGAGSTITWTVSGGQAANDQKISFAANNGASTINVVAVGIVSAQTGGNLLWYKVLGSAVPVASGQQPEIQPGNMTITED